MFYLPIVEFYITNVCNLTCRGCNRFNNLGLKGFERWTEHEKEYEAWSKRINFGKITIIGGEPTLNPDLLSWCKNLRKLWPESTIMIQSNGTYVRQEFRNLWDLYNIGVTISLHDREAVSKTVYQWRDQAYFIDAFTFHQNALIEKDGYFTVHNSDIGQAFRACDMKYDATMVRGKLYKCPTVAILPEVYAQKDLRLSSRQLEIMKSYTPLLADCKDEELEQFFASKDIPINNCEFCPASLKWHTALGELKENLPPATFEQYDENKNNKKTS